MADFSIVKNVDKATPQLFDATCAGDRISEATFTARKAGKGQQEFLIIKMNDVIITSVSPAGNNTNDRPLEQVALSFSKSEITYIPQDPKGGAGSPVTSSCRPRADSSDHEE